MAVSTVRRALSPWPKDSTFTSILSLFHTLVHLVRITISFLLLPLDNTVLLASFLVGHLPLPAISPARRRRQSVLRNVHFYPKTVLITGIDTPHGLALARGWNDEGHRVIGADVTNLPIRSGESMSRSLTSFYQIPKFQYVSRLLDVIHREKVDIWIPCSEKVSVMEDAMAKQVIESRTECKSIHLDTEMANQLDTPELFVRFLQERDLPIIENHQVQSRDSVHRILHRSPNKTYHLRKLNPIVKDSQVVALPKRTLSMTYSEVSEIKITKETPWILQQQTRLGEFIAEVLVVRGQLKAIKIRPAKEQPNWGESRLDKALASAIHRVMERFATKGGSRLTCHLSVNLMVDEEFDNNSVRHVVHIAGCTQGARAVKNLLLHEPSTSISAGYLAMLSDRPRSKDLPGEDIISTTRKPGFNVYRTVRAFILTFIPSLRPVIRRLDKVMGGLGQFLFWKDSRFSYLDPLPWWWHAHIYRPLQHVGMILHQRDEK
ncbi:hypothetical protein ASPWEDRAFT_35039 [Aspergillus wentii DTO 134E9]|uniref:ATP-grasp domain-containing protein n=1 Tax=Aspergillus wentii DTO 134E9 TaxID=1073089 RepID=A0A1L9S2U8_ASPWE|nr:uncharacterized protein ASPWEDRAFT_35039 [Aspergillus wentii DTO 134E9]KAI9929827.1 hypothetical protein MW887_011632 [Aspergillus wentii]OJJ41479.1 hypothetical protein ASPWEDRAFT_35039 [Aspergillus wentii DTO 134E9]